MRMLKVTLAYDGTGFLGWQKQSKGRTVQGVLHQAIWKMHKTEFPILASGRTDAGVHAYGQVVAFESSLDHIPLYTYPKALNGFLPQDIRVKSVEQVSMDFHPRYHATKRIYTYNIDCFSAASPSQSSYSWRIPRSPQIQVLNAFASKIIGTHDFTALSQPNDDIPNRVRTVYSSSFYPRGGFLVYEISGRSFLWKMVRSIVGSLVSYEQQGLDPDYITQVIESKNRSLAGPTAPAKGLFLDRIEYPKGNPS